MTTSRRDPLNVYGKDFFKRPQVKVIVLLNGLITQMDLPLVAKQVNQDNE